MIVASYSGENQHQRNLVGGLEERSARVINAGKPGGVEVGHVYRYKELRSYWFHRTRVIAIKITQV